MSEPFIIDAHTHLGRAAQLAVPDASVPAVLANMNRFAIRWSIASSHTALLGGTGTGLPELRRAYDESQGRIRALAVFNPRCAEACLRELEEARGWPGLVGIKIHPSFHGVAAENEAYRPAWEYAAAHDLAMLAHTWSLSDHNPAQALSVPARFEAYVRKFASVRLVMGHAGGRGTGRHDALRLAREHANAYIDFAGDIYCYRLIEDLVAAVSARKILFGSDWPWTGPGEHLNCVLLSEISEEDRMSILRGNAMDVYRIGEHAC